MTLIKFYIFERLLQCIQTVSFYVICLKNKTLRILVHLMVLKLSVVQTMTIHGEKAHNLSYTKISIVGIHLQFVLVSI